MRKFRVKLRNATIYPLEVKFSTKKSELYSSLMLYVSKLTPYGKFATRPLVVVMVVVVVVVPTY